LGGTQTAKVGSKVALIIGKFGSQRKHYNRSNIFVTFVQCTYSDTCDVCNKVLRISKRPNALLHTP